MNPGLQKLKTHDLLKSLISIALVTDIDGTVYTWQWLLYLMLTIGERYSSRRKIVEPLKYAIYEYKMRRKPFPEVMHLAIAILPDLFAGLPQARVRQIAKSIVASEASRVYSFPAWVIAQIGIENKERVGRGLPPGLMFAITGSPQDIAEPFGEALGLHAVIGCEYFVDVKGRYTGERDERTAIDKGEIIQFLKAAGYDFSSAIGMGDSPSDIPIFLAAAARFAINPNDQLLQYIEADPELRIVWVQDGQKSHRHFFAFDRKLGAFVEKRRWNGFLASTVQERHPFLMQAWSLSRR